jgi:hypothetical protein
MSAIFADGNAGKVHNATLAGVKVPCDTCPQATACRAKELACHDFYRWLMLRGVRSKPENRQATHERYLQIMNNDDLMKGNGNG